MHFYSSPWKTAEILGISRVILHVIVRWFTNLLNSTWFLGFCIWSLLLHILYHIILRGNSTALGWQVSSTVRPSGTTRRSLKRLRFVLFCKGEEMENYCVFKTCLPIWKCACLPVFFYGLNQLMVCFIILIRGIRCTISTDNLMRRK